MNEKPDLDLIQMVQRARMQHDEQATPSQIQAVYWIEAKYNASPTPRAGQWVCEVSPEQVDTVWEKIKQATQAGELGYKSKVSTAVRQGRHRLCVCTVDAQHAADVQRVYNVLVQLFPDVTWRYEAG
ncbi:MAG: hypothetical protein Kow00117_13440 [Phototrophicales bacterium]